MRIAAAQTRPHDGDVESNLQDHCQLARLAAEDGAELVVFPEMSLTGYSTTAASRLALSLDDPRLLALRQTAGDHGITIVAGAPVRLRHGLAIGSLIISPSGALALYTKQFPTATEQRFFSPDADHCPLVEIGAERIAFAICADINHPQHAARASAGGATVLCASIFFAPDEMEGAHRLLAGYAKQHSLAVLMANYSGESSGSPAGGRSAGWSRRGELLAELSTGDLGLVSCDLTGVRAARAVGRQSRQ